MKTFASIFFLLLSTTFHSTAQVFDHAVLADLSVPCTQQAGYMDEEGNSFRLEKDESNAPIFIAKYSPQGALLWKKQTHGYQQGMIRILPSGEVFFLATQKYQINIVLSKYDPDGTLEWEFLATCPDNTGYAILKDLQLDSNQDIIIGGSLSGTYLFDTTELSPSAILGNSSLYGVFLAKFGNDGTLRWAKVSHDLETEFSEPKLFSLVLDEQNNIYTCGRFIGATEFDQVTLVASGYDDFFIGKYSSDGKLLWITPAGSNDSYQFGSFTGRICLDASGFIHFSGSYSYLESTDVKLYFGDQTLSVPDNSSFPLYFYARINQTLAPKVFYRINCGGPQLTDPEMNWAGDHQLNPSPLLDPESSNHTTGTAFTWKGTNTTEAPKDVFGSNRYMISWSNKLAYNFPIEDGLYKVNLYFAEKDIEPGVSQPEARVFDIALDGRIAYQNLDIYKSGGMAAVQKSFVVYAGEVLSIDFLRKVYNPQVNGIEIVSLNSKDASTVVLSNSPGNHVVKKGLTILHDSGRIIVKDFERSNGSLQVQVCDNLGRIYYAESISAYADELEINAQSLPSGMYVVRVNEQAGKLILE